MFLTEYLRHNSYCASFNFLSTGYIFICLSCGATTMAFMNIVHVGWKKVHA